MVIFANLDRVRLIIALGLGTAVTSVCNLSWELVGFSQILIFLLGLLQFNLLNSHSPALQVFLAMQ